MRALHGDDERVLAARSIGGVTIFVFQQYPVLPRNRRQLTCAHSEKRLGRSRLGLVVQDAEAPILLLRCPQPHAGASSSSEHRGSTRTALDPPPSSGDSARVPARPSTPPAGRKRFLLV